MSLKLTPQGSVLLSYALAGTQRIEFTHVRVGSGTDAGPNPTDMDHAVLTVPFQSIIARDSKATLTAVFNNSSLQTGFRMTEIGVYAFDPEDPNTPCLYAYEYIPYANADFIPANSDRVLETRLTLMVFVGAAANVTVRLDQNVYAAFPRDTASGSPASFPDGADSVPVVDLRIAIDLAQAGSGTPSPANVRPITPWTGLTVYHSGEDTSDPEELAVSWADDVGPVYAGELDVTGGVLSEAYYDASQDAMGMAVTGNTPNNTVQARFRPALQAFSSTSTDIKSDRFSNANGSGQSGMISRVSLSDGAWIYLNIPQSELGGTTTEDVQAWATAKKPVILLLRTTPAAHQITPTDLWTRRGENNLWADTGDVTVEYRADTGLYIDKKLAELQATLTENT